MKKRAAATKGGQQRFHRGTRYTIVSPSGYGTPVRVLDVVNLDGSRRGLLVAIDRRAVR